jgi:hypothetical protein
MHLSLTHTQSPSRGVLASRHSRRWRRAAQTSLPLYIWRRRGWTQRGSGCFSCSPRAPTAPPPAAAPADVYRGVLMTGATKDLCSARLNTRTTPRTRMVRPSISMSLVWRFTPASAASGPLTRRTRCAPSLSSSHPVHAKRLPALRHPAQWRFFLQRRIGTGAGLPYKFQYVQSRVLPSAVHPAAHPQSLTLVLLVLWSLDL